MSTFPKVAALTEGGTSINKVPTRDQLYAMARSYADGNSPSRYALCDAGDWCDYYSDIVDYILSFFYGPKEDE